MIGRALGLVKTEGKRLVKYTVVCGAIGAGGCACLGKIIFRELHDKYLGDVLENFHEKYPIPPRYHSWADGAIRRIFDFVLNKHEAEVVNQLAVYGAATGISFGFSAGVLRVTTGVVWNAVRAVSSRSKTI